MVFSSEKYLKAQARAVTRGAQGVDCVGYDREDYESIFRIQAWQAEQKCPAGVDVGRWTVAAIRNKALNCRRDRVYRAVSIARVAAIDAQEPVDHGQEARFVMRDLVEKLRRQLSPGAWDRLTVTVAAGSYREALKIRPDFGPLWVHRAQVVEIKARCRAILARHENFSSAP